MQPPTSYNKTLSLTGAVLLFVGVVFSMALSIMAIWADTEATFYGFKRLGEDRLMTLRCPVLLTTHGPGLVTASFKNQGEKAVNLMIYASFSSPGAINKQDETLPLKVDETRTKTWEVGEENVDLRYFVFAQIGHYAAASMPFRYNTCGMVMMDIPFLSGDQLFVLWFLLGVGSLLGGLFVLYRSADPLDGKRLETYRAMRFLAIIVLLCLLVALLGEWMIGIVLVAGALLAGVSIFVRVLAT